MKKVGLSIAFLLFAAPVYAHHVPGRASARVVISIPNPNPSLPPLASVILTADSTNPDTKLNCREETTTTRNVICNLPARAAGQPFRIPAGPATGLGGAVQFEIYRTVAATDAQLNPLGAEFVVLCNAVNGGPCDNTIQYKFQNSTIKKTGGSGTATQQVKIEMGFTIGILPNATLNPTTLDATSGRAHGFSSRGSFVPAGTVTALGNTHTAAATFTYVLSNATCGTTDVSTPEPFSISGCTAPMAIPCSSPTPLSTNGVTCNSSGLGYEVKSSTLTSWNSISVAGKLDLLDGTQRTCANLFGAGKTCRAIERGTATLSYGLRRINDRVNITASGEGNSGVIQDVKALSAGEGVKCSLHESNGGTSINPNDNGNFKVQVFGSAQFDTSTMDRTNTWIGLPGGGKIFASDIRPNQTFNDPETGQPDGFFDAWVIYDSSQLANPGGITCAPEFAGQTITLVQESLAEVLVSGQIEVADKGKNPKSFGEFNDRKSVLTSCEMPATVGPCNNP